MYSGKRIIRTKVPSLQELAIEAMKENIESSYLENFLLLCLLLTILFIRPFP